MDSRNDETTNWPRGRSIRLALAAFVIAGGTFFVLAALLPPFPEDNVPLRLAGVVAVGGLTLLISVSLVRHNAATIHGDAIVMATPIKGVGGVPTRTVRFEDLVDAQPGVRDGLTGAKVLLPGGSSLFLAQADLGPDGTASLERLCNRFGRSYDEELKRILLQGSAGHGFPVSRVKRAERDSMLLQRALKTRSGKRTRRVLFSQVKQVERVTTPYLGNGLLLSLLDGTRFIIPSSDEEQLASLLVLKGVM